MLILKIYRAKQNRREEFVLPKNLQFLTIFKLNITNNYNNKSYLSSFRTLIYDDSKKKKFVFYFRIISAKKNIFQMLQIIHLHLKFFLQL